jgi:hypothetical protein
VPHTTTRSKRSFGVALAGAAAVVALLGLALGHSAGAAAAPTKQQNIVRTAAAAGQLKTLLSSRSRPVSSARFPARGR